ncbi:MAG TPA: hypothetical protein PKD00_00460 [Burkholderiales bacterium]|nr:hypothetical protein [Burkholderiales bacterium]
MATGQFFNMTPYSKWVLPEVNWELLFKSGATEQARGEKAEQKYSDFMALSDNLDLHEKYYDSYNNWKQTTDKEIDDLINKHGGKLGTTGFNRDMDRLISQKKTDPWLKNAVAASKQAKLYEEKVMQNPDIQPYNDPNAEEYTKWLSDESPTFKYKGFYKDAPPEVWMRQTLSAMPVTELTTFAEIGKYGLETINTKAKFSADMIAKARKLKGEFINTDNGRELQRRIDSGFYGEDATFDDVYDAYITTIAESMAFENNTKTRSADVDKVTKENVKQKIEDRKLQERNMILDYEIQKRNAETNAKELQARIDANAFSKTASSYTQPHALDDSVGLAYNQARTTNPTIVSEAFNKGELRLKIAKAGEVKNLYSNSKDNVIVQEGGKGIKIIGQKGKQIDYPMDNAAIKKHLMESEFGYTPTDVVVFKPNESGVAQAYIEVKGPRMSESQFTKYYKAYKLDGAKMDDFKVQDDVYQMTFLVPNSEITEYTNARQFFGAPVSSSTTPPPITTTIDTSMNDSPKIVEDPLADFSVIGPNGINLDFMTKNPSKEKTIGPFPLYDEQSGRYKVVKYKREGDRVKKYELTGSEGSENMVAIFSLNNPEEVKELKDNFTTSMEKVNALHEKGSIANKNAAKNMDENTFLNANYKPTPDNKGFEQFSIGDKPLTTAPRTFEFKNGTSLSLVLDSTNNLRYQNKDGSWTSVPPKGIDAFLQEFSSKVVREVTENKN